MGVRHLMMNREGCGTKLSWRALNLLLQTEKSTNVKNLIDIQI